MTARIVIELAEPALAPHRQSPEPSSLIVVDPFSGTLLRERGTGFEASTAALLGFTPELDTAASLTLLEDFTSDPARATGQFPILVWRGATYPVRSRVVCVLLSPDDGESLVFARVSPVGDRTEFASLEDAQAACLPGDRVERQVRSVWLPASAADVAVSS
ncbi:hypothetical protein [Serinibacter salmoneus]|uniref:Uncharacterized protein n=1 Tax=Serinibacter salmoneus TaxID=556530 RepID=A0A2A9D1V9_9MICO|nr:hypothetical protein [Serinibacter salmoneus]PFG19839.1 hypothetical protein ATL40_1415 [Serinibacter salmoneus]